MKRSATAAQRPAAGAGAGAGAASARVERHLARDHLHALAHLELPFDDDTIARNEAARRLPEAGAGVLAFDTATLHDVTLAQHVDRRRALDRGDGLARNHERVLHEPGLTADARELPGTQHPLGIGKLGLDGQRPGPRVDAAVDRDHAPGQRVKRAVCQSEANLDGRCTRRRLRGSASGGGRLCAAFLEDAQVVGLGNLEAHPRRREVGDDRHRRPAGNPDEIADRRRHQARTARDGRRHARVAQVDFPRLDDGARGRHVGGRDLRLGAGIVALLAWDQPPGGEVGVAVGIGLRPCGLDLRLRQAGLGLREGCLEGFRVDREQQLPRLHVGARLEVDALEVSLHAGADLDVLLASDLTDELLGAGQVALRGDRHVDRGGRGGCRRTGGLATAAGGQCEQRRGDEAPG
jgi:hypothetical protein